MTLADFLRSQTAASGAWNCSTLPADWCMALGHPDFAAAWRDVTDPGDCEAVPAAAGGLIALWDRGIGDALPMVETLAPGDIAVVAVAGFEAGAIWSGERWVIRAPRGLHFVAADAVAMRRAWRP